jgi:glycosyltransferase involved in cell wall biosynthesis
MGAYATWVASQSGLKNPAPLRDVSRKLFKIPWLYKLTRKVHHCWGNPSIPSQTESFLRRQLLAARQTRTVPSLSKLNVLHCIGALIPGGAERQLCNFVVGANRRGLSVRVLTLRESIEEDGHYSDLLHAAGIHSFVAGAEFNSDFVQKLRTTPATVEFLHHLPMFFHPYISDIFGEILTNPPDLLHAWLDHNNVWAGLAAVLAGVPHIVLSTRNVNPSHFPYLAHPLFKPWYQVLATFPQVHFINNSWAGARDYAEWLELPVNRFHVVHNGVDFSTVVRPTEIDVQSFRKELRLSPAAPLVAGVFRLSEEKQPLVFFEVMRRAMLKVHDLHAVIAGVGPCEGELRAAITQANLCTRFHLLGRRKDINVIMSSATVLLLTSRHEGTPNVLLEAQWLGCPVVSTRAGGAVDAVDHNRTGLLLDVGDIEGLTEALLKLLGDRQQRQCFAESGPGFIRSRFGVDRMIEETLAVYQRTLSDFQAT